VSFVSIVFLVKSNACVQKTHRQKVTTLLPVGEKSKVGYRLSPRRQLLQNSSEGSEGDALSHRRANTRFASSDLISRVT